MFSSMLIELERRAEDRRGVAHTQGEKSGTMPVTVVRSSADSCPGPDCDGRRTPAQSRRCVLRREIGSFIQHRLGDPGLTPAAIAEAHHISVRYLYQVFDTHQMTVAAWIRHCRLERCHRDLANPRLCSRSIRAVAARWGFSNPAHFSRAFRAAYGMSPRDHRDWALGHCLAPAGAERCPQNNRPVPEESAVR